MIFQHNLNYQIRTNELLIGICCGYASVIFITLALIIMMNQQILSNEYSISDEENDQIISEPNIEITEMSDDNSNLDFGN